MGRVIAAGEGILNKSNVGEMIWICTSANIFIYVLEMTELEINDNLVTLQPGSSQLFSENDLIMKYEVDQTSINSTIFFVFQYYLKGDVDVAHNTMTNALFNAKIKMLQLHYIFFEDEFSHFLRGWTCIVHGMSSLHIDL